jgi:hypothetical protein
VALARGDGRHARLLKTIARVELLILDDWGLASLTPAQGRDLLEIVDDRHGRGSTIVTSQLPVEQWHATPWFGSPGGSIAPNIELRALAKPASLKSADVSEAASSNLTLRKLS